ncbi:FRG domain-containing protein [Tissierella sp.]|uniref:FRG domain-containing protein n=1 Tax=Tissierella sp. TaxID=41274 RepID=UPI002856ED32|nr:FRG domain-containing protein [Tissierella sp.]MDR7856119.1 FRG domain-containing protein [Tissierella sp.]
MAEQREIKGKEIHGIQDYISILDKLIYQFTRTKMGGELSFRGISNSNYKLIPNIYRKKIEQFNGIENNVYWEPENEILSHFIKEASCYVNGIDTKDYLSWLEYAQHFGAPTRLLDFTSNSLVALYFCCKENQELDGTVWILHESNYRNFVNKNSRYSVNNGPLSRIQILDDIIKNIEDSNHSCIEYPCSYIPRYIDIRMSAQESRFLIWGSKTESLEDLIESKNFMTVNEQGGIAKDEMFIYKIRVPSTHKPKIIKQLNLCGVNEKRLFPGLDGVGKYISNYYSMSYDDYVRTFN